jgi:chromosome partitioning protein
MEGRVPGDTQRPEGDGVLPGIADASRPSVEVPRETRVTSESILAGRLTAKVWPPSQAADRHEGATDAEAVLEVLIGLSPAQGDAADPGAPNETERLSAGDGYTETKTDTDTDEADFRDDNATGVDSAKRKAGGDHVSGERPAEGGRPAVGVGERDWGRAVATTSGPDQEDGLTTPQPPREARAVAESVPVMGTLDGPGVSRETGSDESHMVMTSTRAEAVEPTKPMAVGVATVRTADRDPGDVVFREARPRPPREEGTAAHWSHEADSEPVDAVPIVPSGSSTVPTGGSPVTGVTQAREVSISRETRGGGPVSRETEPANHPDATGLVSVGTRTADPPATQGQSPSDPAVSSVENGLRGVASATVTGKTKSPACPESPPDDSSRQTSPSGAAAPSDDGSAAMHEATTGERSGSLTVWGPAGTGVEPPTVSPTTTNWEPPGLSPYLEDHERANLVDSLPLVDESTPLAFEVAQDARRRISLVGRPFPPPPRTRILTVANQKGGVGKTTTTVNLAAAMAQSGMRVLVLDIDPQGNASTALGIDHHSEVPSLYDVVVEGRPLGEVLQPCPDVPNLWCAPATIDLAGAEIELVSLVARETRLQKALYTFLMDREEQGHPQIDYIFIDCPPSLSLLTVNAFVAAQEVFIPIQCEYYALEGLSQLLKHVELIRGHLNPSLHVSTILLTMYDGRTRLSSQVADEVRTHFPDQVVRTTVPRSVRISEAPSHGQTVMTYDPASSGALSYLEAARELAEQVLRWDDGTTQEEQA